MMNGVIVFGETGFSGSGFGYDTISASNTTSTSMSVCKWMNRFDFEKTLNREWIFRESVIPVRWRSTVESPLFSSIHATHPFTTSRSTALLVSILFTDVSSKQESSRGAILCSRRSRSWSEYPSFRFHSTTRIFLSFQLDWIVHISARVCTAIFCWYLDTLCGKAIR